MLVAFRIRLTSWLLLACGLNLNYGLTNQINRNRLTCHEHRGTEARVFMIHMIKRSVAVMITGFLGNKAHST
jgi:hypothetical protein